MLKTLRKLRDSSPVLRSVHHVVREPYYRGLEAFYPTGAPSRLPDGTRVRLHPRLLGMRPEIYEPAVAAVITKRVSRGGVVIDVGAHVGLHTLSLSHRVGSSGRVIAIEASPANAELLRRHLSWNGCTNVTVVEAVVGSHESVVEFAYRPVATDPGAFANSVAYDIGGSRQRVAMNTLSAICDGLIPDLVKIDVEGAEMAVIVGAEELLARARPTLIVAVHPEPLAKLGSNPADLVNFLETRGYRGQHLDGRPAVSPGFEEIVFENREGDTAARC